MQDLLTRGHIQRVRQPVLSQWMASWPQRHYPAPFEAVTVTIGGQTVTPEYAGGAPGEIAGLMQINVRIPGTVAPGNAAPVAIQVGQSRQPGVTLAIGNSDE